MKVQLNLLFKFNRRVASKRPSKGLSCMMGNYHVQFLGGKGP
jgi:hypothetical protein